MSKKLFLVFSLAAALLFTFGAGQSMAMYSPGGSGDLLLGQIYDVRATDNRPAQWENYFTIRNTSDTWVAFHLRFRAQTKSIEVWDRIILLSPYDVFWFDLQRDANGGGVLIYSSDTHTLLNSGIIKVGETEFTEKFQTSLLEACGYTTGTLAETEMGYVEAIGLWSINSTSHAIGTIAGNTYLDPDDPTAINVYDLLFDMWGSERGDRPLVYAPTSTEFEFIDCPNVLQGEFEMGDVVTGAYQLENMVGFLDFRTDTTTDHRDGYDSGVIGFPVYVLLPGDRCYTDGLTGFPDQDIAWYNNPDVNTTAGPTLLDGDAWFGSGPNPDTPDDDSFFNAAWSLPDVERRLFTYERWGYFINSEVGDAPFNADVKTDVVLTFPTKYHHYWFAGWPYWNGVGNNYLLPATYWQAITAYRAGLKAKWDGIINAPCFVGGYIWDSEQNRENLSPGPSPNPWQAPYVPHEVNVIRVGNIGDILETDYTHGQFVIEDWVFTDDQRADALGRDSGFSEYPLLGLTIRKHNAPGSPFVYRTSMTSMQFKTHFDLAPWWFIDGVNYSTPWPMP